MTLRLAFVLCVLIAGLASAAAQAITFGQPDGDLHPNVAAVLADYDEESPGPEILCTGTLIAEDVVLTAGHCTAFLEAEGITDIWVTFAPEYDEDSSSLVGLLHGSYVTHPDYPGPSSDPHDLAVILLDDPVVGITPAGLPEAGLLDEMKADASLQTATFTAVGYGTVREDKRGGPHAFFFDGVRRFALQDLLSLQNAWLTLNMNPSTGGAGTCYGDSGGPHFLGDETSNLMVSITITGDAMCRATDHTYRLDTEAAREFLGDYVALP